MTANHIGTLLSLKVRASKASTHRDAIRKSDPMARPEIRLLNRAGPGNHDKERALAGLGRGTQASVRNASGFTVVQLRLDQASRRTLILPVAVLGSSVNIVNAAGTANAPCSFWQTLSVALLLRSPHT